MIRRKCDPQNAFEGGQSIPLETTHSDLTGQCLIAMPGMGDPRFAHAVVYMCAHSDEGAMGLIINKPNDELRLGDLLAQLELAHNETHASRAVYFGGPVETGRGFVLHTPDYRSPVATLEVTETMSMTATLDVLEELGAGKGPERFVMALGYSGWGPGQLESEIAENGWLTCPTDHALVFDTPDTAKWETALERIGVPALALSAEAGHA
ncbi:YqgE/AlgH family protein [Primorskyibacter sp. S187A]|uniref:YqgE/AlgH family protein n=1 Tax=Primorskyibacter sp. S187A TaxID=3415130 RepID=UPI003C7E5C7B